MLSLGSASSSGRFEAKGWIQMLKHSAECMTCTIKRRLEHTGCMKILAAITSSIAKIRRLYSSAIVPTTKWPTGWKSEWFYIKADEKKRGKLMTMVMCPLALSFGMTRPLCNMMPGSTCQLFVAEFRVVAEQISTRDLVQECLANRTSPMLSEFSMSELKGTKKTLELVR